MKKSFKKAIAAMLAVLMVVCSLPMTAFAAPGDYKPNVILRFGTCSNIMGTGLLCGEGAYDCDLSKKNSDASDSLGLAGMYGAPIDYDYKNGVLTLKADKVNAEGGFAENYGAGIEEDYTYTVGDYFVVTVAVENVATCKNLDTRFTYSANIEPAGVYGYNAVLKRAFAFKSLSEATADGSDVKATAQAAAAPFAGQCSDAFYANINEIAGDLSEFDPEARTFHTQAVASIDAQDTSSIEGAAPIFDPETGSAGYNYPNTMVLESYMFKITGEGPIKFELEDPDNSIHRDFSGCYYIADDADGAAITLYTTYAPQYFKDGTECPGSRTMTYMNENIHKQTTTECTHDNTTLTEDAKTPATCISTGLMDILEICNNPDCKNPVIRDDKNVVIPIDPTNHAGTTTESEAEVITAATCSTTGVGKVTVTCDDCGEVIETKNVELALDLSNHTDVTSDVTPATCTEDGYTTFTCNDCGESWTGEPTTATGHAYDDWAHVTGTEKADAQHSRVCANDATHVETEACDFDYDETIPASVTSEGLGTFTCKVCDYSYTVVIEIQKCNHDNTTDVETSRTAATCVAAGEINYDVVCDDCHETIKTKTEPIAIDPANHADAPTDTRDVNVVPATCGEAGSKDVETYCTACGVTLSTDTGVPIPATNNHEATTDVETSRTAATCVAEGEVNYNVVCDECGTVVNTKTETLDKDPANHADAATATRDANVVEATCGAAGSKDVETYCTACGVTRSTENEVIPATGNHTAGEPVTTVTKPATVDEAGIKTTTVNCTVCGELLDSQPEEIPVIPSYTVTVEPATLGTVTINGVDATNGAEVKVAKDPVSQVTLVATPNDENVTFVGWMANGKTLVSTDETRVATVLANITYTPVFALSDTEFTVTFVDAYGNVIDTQKVADAAAIVMPTAPTRPGYTFTDWSMTADEIAAIDGATTIQAVYEKNASDLFTVTANGCTITVNGADVADFAEDVAYDTRVTVTADGATAWKIGDVIVAYGDSYTFYVGSDVEVTPVTTAVTAEPTVANVSKTPVVEANGLKRCTFLATRSMEGFKCVNYGFVYANTKNLDITLDDVNGTTVKAFYCQTGVDQFSLTYGLKSQTGTVSVRAFVAYIDAQGKTQVKYADADTFSYDK